MASREHLWRRMQLITLLLWSLYGTRILLVWYRRTVAATGTVALVCVDLMRFFVDFSDAEYCICLTRTILSTPNSTGTIAAMMIWRLTTASSKAAWQQLLARE